MIYMFLIDNKDLVKGQVTIKLNKENIKICPKCGRIASKDSNFCMYCPGVPLAKVEFE